MITTATLRAPWRAKDRWIADEASRGAGKLVVRITREAVLLYFQYFIPPSVGEAQARRELKKLLPLGVYDEAGRRGFSLAQARSRAAQLSALHRQGFKDLHAHLEAEGQARERDKAAADERAREIARDADKGTLKLLLESYVRHLEQTGRVSARDAKSIFNKHILRAAPKLAARKATELTVDDFVAPISRLVEDGKGRTADKLRSYLRAAYQLALESRTNPGVPLALRSYGISVNPIVSIKALSQFNRARERVLSADELAAYWIRLGQLQPCAQKDALRLLLFLGGQRPLQLLRLTPLEVDLSNDTITLYDGKGARKRPRVHVVPLVKEASEILRRRISTLEENEPLFSTDHRTSMRVETLSVEVSVMANQMRGASPPEAREHFQLRDLRRTCETLMASLGISRDIRAQIQSHGLGGIQMRHYDRHSYYEEKKTALEQWASFLMRLSRTHVCANQASSG